jgi:hypothetical protein
MSMWKLNILVALTLVAASLAAGSREIRAQGQNARIKRILRAAMESQGPLRSRSPALKKTRGHPAH